MTMRPTPTPTRKPTMQIAPFFYAVLLVAGIHLSVAGWISPTFPLWKTAVGGFLLGVFATRAVRR